MHTDPEVKQFDPHGFEQHWLLVHACPGEQHSAPQMLPTEQHDPFRHVEPAGHSPVGTAGLQAVDGEMHVLLTQT
jgi:hypothetical protein